MAMFAVLHLDGPAVLIRPMRLTRPTPQQVRARRNNLWLFAVEIGLPVHPGGRAVKHTPAEIARLFGVSRRAVADGLASARALRREVRDYDATSA